MLFNHSAICVTTHGQETHNHAYPWQTAFIKQHSGSALLLQLSVPGLPLQSPGTDGTNFLQLQTAVSTGAARIMPDKL